GRLVDRTFRAAVYDCKEMTATLPRSGVHRVGIRAVDDNVRRARVFGPRDHCFPCFAAVGRLEEAAFAAPGPKRPLCGNKNDIAVARVDHDLANMLRGFQPDVSPCPAAIVRTVYAVAVADASLAVVFAGRSEEHTSELQS